MSTHNQRAALPLPAKAGSLRAAILMKRETTLPPHLDPVRYVLVYNESSEAVPPFGVMRIVRPGANGSLRVNRPNRNGMTNVIVNGPHPIEPASYGQASFNWPAKVGYIQVAGVIRFGDEAGVVKDKWFLSPNHPGFRCITPSGESTAIFERILALPVSHVEITSLTKTGKLYPAIEVIYNPDTDAFEYGDVCWWRDAND